MSDLTEKNIGKMFSVPWSPNPHRLEFIRDSHCQLHGELIGREAGLRKRRNSEKRPWGSISVCDVERTDARLILEEQSQ